MGKITTKLRRLIKMISLLESKYGQYSRQEIMDILGIQSSSSFYRYLDDLKKVDIPVTQSDKTGNYKIRGDYYLELTGLTISEALALVVGGKMILSNEDLPYSKEMNLAITKLLSALPDRTSSLISKLEQRIHFSLKSLVDSSQYGEAFNKLEEAVKEELNVWVKYDPRSSDEITERKISPYAVDIREGDLYCHGYCHLRNDMRTFRIDRMLEINILEEGFDYPEDFSLKEYLGNAWGVERGKAEQEVKIRFSGDAVRVVKEHNYHSTQELEELEDGDLLMTIRTCSINEIKEWILGFGAQAEVIEPEDLREEVKEEVRGMNQIYSDRGRINK